MLNRLKGILPYWPIMLCMLATAIVGSTDRFMNLAMHGKIYADAQGYYGYLVAIFLERSFDWQQVIGSYGSTYYGKGAVDFTVQTDLGSVNKYYVGTAIMVLPFFLVTCAVAWLLGFPVDAYSPPFHIGAMLTALFYIGLGIYFLVRFLKEKGIGHNIAMFVGITCFLASGLVYYSAQEPLMSHAYSFSVFCIFLFTANRAMELPGIKWAAGAAAVFALIILIRPSNGLILFSVPFIAGGFGPFITKLKRKPQLWRLFFIAAIVVVAIVSVQAFMYWLQVGSPMVWAYHGEGFDFSDPEMFNVLLSYRKGFFVYTPWAFLGAVGLFFLLIRKRSEGLAVWLFLGLSVYVISSWWCWYYGSSFGMRALIDYLPFFAYGLAHLIQHSAPLARIVLVALTLITVPINLVQCYQYNKFILHWHDMNCESYWRVFMKTDREYQGILWNKDKEAPSPVGEKIAGRIVFESDLEDDLSWGAQGLDSTKSFSGLYSTMINADVQYGSTLGIPVSEMGSEGEKALHFSAMIWAEEEFPDLSIASSYRGGNGDYGHLYIGIGHHVKNAGEWIKVEQTFALPISEDSTDSWVIYPMTSGSADIYLDDIRYEMITLKD